MQSADGGGQKTAWTAVGRAARCGRWLTTLLLALLVAACAGPNAQPAASADGTQPAGTDAAPKLPQVTCKPEPFCMSDCKRQGYPNAYCNLRCGC